MRNQEGKIDNLVPRASFRYKRKAKKRDEVGKIDLQKKAHRRKMPCHFKLNMYVFLSNIPHFLPLFNNLMIWLYFFFILLLLLQWYLYTQYVFNQNMYRTKWFTILEIQFIGNLELFWIKKILVSTINTMGGTLCGGIISERSKIWKYPAIPYWLVCISKNVILF